MGDQDIRLRRGPQAGIPALADGEPGFSTDTKRLYVGYGGANWLIGDSGAASQRRFYYQVSRIRNNGTNLSVGSWFDAYPYTRSSGSFSGYYRKCQPMQIPFACAVSRIALTFSDCRYESLGSPGPISVLLDILGMDDSQAGSICQYRLELPGPYSGNSLPDGFYQFEPTFTTYDGLNEYASGDLVGVVLRQEDGDPEGSVNRLGDPIVLFEFEEIL